jgi:hypothetical protein
LKFDFSTINPRSDLTEADQRLTKSLNSSIKKFYKTYATYLDEDVTGLCGNIDIDSDPGLSLQNCNELVQSALSRAREQENEQLAGVRGIYLLVDEYDAFPNNYLDPPNTVEPRKTPWDSTPVGRTFKYF